VSESSESIPYRTGGVSLGIGKAHKVSVPPFTFRARLTGLLFDTSKAFLLPGAIHGMRALKRLHDEHKGMKLLVTGHTDRAGADDYNLKLSGERADSMRAYLRDEVEEWFKFYGASISQEKRWGPTEDSLMIGQVVPPDRLQGGQPPPVTVENIKAFQNFSNENRGTSLDPDGKIGPGTRRALIAAYMAQPDTSLPPEVEILTHGCGEFHNEVPTPDGVAMQENRRVEIFFFDGPIKPAPRKPCPGPGGCPEYEEWKKQSSKTIDLDKGSGTLEITVQDSSGKAIEEASVHLEGPFSEDSATDADGLAKFPDLPAGSYTISAAKDGFDDAETTSNLADGADEKVTLKLKAQKLLVQLVAPDATPLPQRPFRILGGDGAVLAQGKSDDSGSFKATGLPAGKVRLALPDRPRVLRLRARKPGSAEERTFLQVRAGEEIELVFAVKDAKQAQVVGAQGAAVGSPLAVDDKGGGSAKVRVDQLGTFQVIALGDGDEARKSEPSGPVHVAVLPAG
jgi:outer membrane protein OmpA-like peptidoglycan-associated protein